MIQEKAISYNFYMPLAFCMQHAVFVREEPQ
jgi:hypothetical protein